MLAALTRRRNWAWTAHGKHPVARDYFTLGGDDPLARAFIDWLNRGVQALPGQQELLSSPCSWRFWSRSPEKDHLACGMVKNSFDGMRRFFPLLVMGTGRVKGWQQHWDLVPLLYEETWGRIERVAAQKFSDLAQFRSALGQLPPAGKSWSELETLFGGPVAAPDCAPGNPVRKAAETLRRAGHACLPLKMVSEQDLTLAAMRLHQELKGLLPAPPAAVFMGGLLDQCYLMLFTRPLGPEDFTRLWVPDALG